MIARVLRLFRRRRSCGARWPLAPWVRCAAQRRGHTGSHHRAGELRGGWSYHLLWHPPRSDH